MGIFSGILTKMMFKIISLSIPNASIQKLEEHYHSIAELLNSSVDADNDILLLKLRKKIIDEMDKRGHISSIF
jgi:hypothetical protein